VHTQGLLLASAGRCMRCGGHLPATTELDDRWQRFQQVRCERGEPHQSSSASFACIAVSSAMMETDHAGLSVPNAMSPWRTRRWWSTCA